MSSYHLDVLQLSQLPEGLLKLRKIWLLVPKPISDTIPSQWAVCDSGTRCFFKKPEIQNWAPCT